MATKLLLDTLRLADGGRVECSVAAPDGTVLRGVIEQSFFEEFATGPAQAMTPVKQGRIVEENIAYLETVAEQQWREGRRELSIK